MKFQELYDEVLTHAQGMWRFRWLALGCTWLICLAGWGAVYLIPERYTATVKVYVDTENVLRPLLRGLYVESNVLTDVAVMTRMMLSYPSLERVARETDLNLRAKTKEEEETLVRGLEKAIAIERQQNDIFSITYSDVNRDMALAVVAELLDSFVEDTLSSTNKDSIQAEKTLKEQLAAYEVRLFEAEDRLKVFKQKNVGLIPGESGDYYAQLSAADAELAKTRHAIEVSEQKKRALRKQLKHQSTASSGDTVVRTPYDARITDTEKLLDDLRLQYTDRHPSVQQNLSLLEELQVQRDDYLKKVEAGELEDAESALLAYDPVYQSVQLKLNNVEVELASQYVDLKQKEENVARLTQLVDVIPQVEAELKRLNRDYDVVRTRYTEMLQRWENLQTGRRVRTGTDQIQFRVIQPPNAPSAPGGPPKMLMTIAVPVMALGGGIGFAFLMNQIRRTFSNLRDLSTTGLPVLGAVSTVVEIVPGGRGTMMNVLFTAAFLLMIAGAVAVTLLVA